LLILGDLEMKKYLVLIFLTIVEWIAVLAYTVAD